VTDIFDNHPEEEQEPEQTSIFDSHPQEDDARPYAAPGSMQDKQRRIQDTVAELRAKNMDTIKAQKAFSLSREEGLPMDVAYRQADQFVKSRKPGEIAALRPDAPAAARHLSEGDNLSLYTEEDVKKLGTWEKLSLQWEKTGRESEESIELSDLGYKMRSGEATKQDEARYYELKQLQASRSDFDDDGWAPFTMSAIHSAIDFTTTAAARSLTAGAQGAAAGAVTFGGIGATAGTVAVPGAGTVAGGAAGAAAGGVFGGTVAFGGEMMRQTFQLVAGQAYLAAKESLDENGDPLSDEAAWNVSTVTGLIGGAFEVLGLKMFSKAVAPSINRMMSRNGVKEFVGKMNQNPVLKSRVANLAKTLAAGGAAEATQEVAEQTAQIVSIMTSGGEFDADGNLTSDQLSLDNLALQALGGFIGGVGMSAGLKAGAKGIETTVNFARNRATARRDTLVQQGDAVRGMTAAKNAPAALAEYAQGLEKDNPSQASAPAEALQTLFQSAGLTEEQVQQQFPELAQSLRDAAETGVEVPLSQETMVKIQTLDAKEAYDEFANDVRLGPDEMTAREAAAEDGTLDEMIANMPEEQKEEAVVASLVEEIVKQQVAEGGMDARTARASATALIKGRVTMMKRAGFTIDEIAAKTTIENKVDPKYQVQVGGGFDVGPNAMQQGLPQRGQTFLLEARPDSLIADAEFIGKLANTDAFMKSGLGGFDVPSQRIVGARVMSMIQNPQVRDTVVGLLPVDVVDILGSKQLTPEMLFDDMTMLTNLFSVDGNDAIPLTVDEAVRVASGITSVIAENLPTLSDIAGVSVDGVAASGAGVSGLQGVSPSGYSVSIDPTTGLSTVQPFDPASDNILFQSAAPIQGRPMPITGTGPGGRVLNRDLGRALTDRHMATYGRALDPSDQMDYQVVLNSMVQDYREQLAQPDTGEAWYSDDIATAIDVTSRIIPELQDPTHRDLFLTMAALLSPQQKPLTNWENAVIAMQGFVADGVIPTRKPNGKQFGVNSHTTGLQLLQHLIDTMGLEAALQWVQSPQTGRTMAEVRQASGLFSEKAKLQGYLPNETNLNETKLGIYMMGPKVGDFMQNSVGIDQSAVTVDLWMARTYNRLIGRLMDVPANVAEAGGLADQVRGRAEREMIKKLVREAAADAGIDPSAMQAALWYFEQRLYRNHGIRSDSQNFSGAAQAAVAKRGVDLEGADGGAAAQGADAGAGSRRASGDGAGRTASGSLAALPGAPTVRGATGPDPSLVAVAESYAREAGISLARQAEFVKADPARGARIAEAYEAMEHAPQDPAVVEAYQNLIDQTMAQYQALERAGYTFTFFDDASDPYEGNPWNAMRDLRANKTMAVYSTVAGFGTLDGFDPSQNPMLQDTGLQWPDQNGNMVPVLANDLFRAVHDAFGHGLEGAGFRADGEENAWQAHVRLFTGSAVAAITTETRGQNSWLNFGPYGETNRTASVEDTVFADQKTGLMPEWTWTEGRAADEVTRLEQNPVFYSALLRGVEASKQPKAGAQQWIGMLKNMPGLKQEELDWLGVEDWLKSQDGPVTREQLAEYIRANSALEDGTVPLDALSDKRLNQAVALKPLVDGAGLGSEELRNILESVSLLSESDRLGSIPSLAPMFSEMRRAAAEKPEVLDAIVGSVPVNVVNNLFGSEAAAKVALHDEAMLKDSAAFNAELPVAGGLGDTPGAVRLLMVEAALAAAEVGSVSLGSGGEAGKQVTAVFTGQGYAFRQGTSPDGLMQGSENAGPRAFIEFTKARDIFKITLTGNANLSSFLHETGHYFLELMTDLVESGQANIQMQQDLQMLRDWAGVGEDGKFTVEQHEKFARGFERYLMEGNAPSTGLRALFNRFKGWLTFIYKSMNNLNVDLTDEVRGVMDRMMASDEEIAKAKRNTGRQNDPMDQEIMGLTDAEYEQYIRMWEASEEAERTKVDARLMKDYLTGQKEAFKNEVSRVTAEMTEQIEKTKAYQVWDELRNREVKIERDSIPADLRQLAFGLWVKDGSGLPMDVMAETMGYDNGKQMLQDIATMRAQLKAVPETAKKTVEEAHGFIDDKEFKRVAEAAIHQKEHEEVTLAEYMALTARDGKKARKGFAAWLNQNAKARVGQMTAQQIKPDHWRRAELKAAQEAAVAVSQKDVTKAALAKRRQMIASAMNRASLEALERVDTIRNEMMRFNKKTRQKALGKAGEAFQNGVNGILELVSFKATTIKSREAAQAVQKMMDEFGPNSVAQIPPEVEALLGKTHYKDMTIDELEALYDTVTTIYTQARKLNKLKSEQREVDFQDWLKEVDKRTRESMGEVRQTARSGRGVRDALVDGLRWSRAQIVKVEFLTGWMDGSTSGGPAKEMLFDPIAKAEADEWDMKKRVYKPIIDRLRSMPKEQRQRLAQKVDFMGNGWNNGAQGTGMNILMAALNMGNAGNMEKLTLGYGWNEEQLRSEVNTFLTKQDWDLVQDILDTVNSLWPDLEREAFKATGIKPPKVEAVPIETPYGEYRGGYFPVAYDLDHIDNKIQMSKITEDGTFVQNFFSPSVSNGMTQKRTKVVSPIRLEPDVLTNHLRDTIHYITHFEAVDQVDKILRRQEFRKLIYETSGEAYYKELRRWLKDVANGSYYTQGEPQLGEKWLHHLRTGTSLAFLGFGIGTMAKQQLGIFTSLQEVKPGYLASGMLQTYNPVTGLRNIKAALAESSELERLIDEWDRDFGKAIDDIGRKLDSTLWDKIRVYAMRGIAMSQLLVNVSTYIGAKNQRLDLGDTPADAQRYAEAAVRMTQSAAGMKDMSPVQRANEATRMITPFFSFAAVLYNRLETIQRETKSIGSVPKAFGKLLTLIIAPAVATVLIDELIASFGEDDEKDEKSLEEKLTLEIVGYTLMGFPIVRDVMSYNYRPSMSPYAQAYEQFQAVPQSAYELATEGEIRRSTAKKAVTGLSIIAKIPAHQPYGYVEDYFKPFDK
jgi:hypothetical protein